MKNIFLFSSLLALFFFSNGQTSTLNTAYRAYKNGDLKQAKDLIEEATQHPKTIKKAKTWKYRGDIYYKIATSGISEIEMLDTNALKKSFTSFKKTLEISPNSIYIEGINQNYSLMQNFAIKEGIKQFQEKAYKRAFNSFLIGYEIAKHLNVTDSVAVYNCALSAQKAGENKNAITWYKKAIEIGYNGEESCQFIVTILQESKRNEEALEQISKCKAKFGETQNLVISELNIYLKLERYEEAILNLNKAIKASPKNEVLYYSLGSLLQKKGENKEAESLYLKALTLNKEYFDANYNLGVYYFNLGADLNNKANNESDVKNYKKIKKQAEEYFNKTTPYLELALQIKPNDNNTLVSLRALYARLNDQENFKRINTLLRSN
jgi:tetratricopeptide (TPR) repeat protein